MSLQAQSLGKKPAPSALGRRERWGAVRRQAAAQWRALSARERRLVSAGAVALFVAGLWLLGIEPALREITRWQADIPRLQSQARAVEDVLRDVPSAASGRPDSAASNAAADPVAALHAELEAAGLRAHAKVQVVAEGAQPVVLEVALTAAPVDRLMPWLMTGPAQSGLSVMRAELIRVDDANADTPTVSGQLRLATPSSPEKGS